MVGVDLLDYSSDQLHDEEIWAVTCGSRFAEDEACPPPLVEGFKAMVHPPATSAKVFSPSDLLSTSPVPFEGTMVLCSDGNVDDDMFRQQWREDEFFTSFLLRDMDEELQQFGDRAVEGRGTGRGAELTNGGSVTLGFLGEVS